MHLGETSWALLKPDNYVEIVGFVIDNILYVGNDALMRAKYGGNVDGIYTKEMARFMACLDVGKRWDELANAPTILIWDNGVPKFPMDEK